MKALDRAASALRPWLAYSGLLRPRSVAVCTVAYVRDLVGRRRYRVLSEEELLASNRSDTVFIFGSGRSLLDIGDEDWRRFAEHDTISMREFPRQNWVRADYHLSAEVDFVEEYAERIRENPLYRETIFVIQGGWRAWRGNQLIGRGLLPLGARIFRYRRVERARMAPPSRSLARGVVHGFNTTTDAVNFAVVLGWRRIVLVGVDLYDKQYFWLPEGETRSYEKPGTRADLPFWNSSEVVEHLGRWARLLESEGVHLLIYNPRSLLAGALEVFDWRAVSTGPSR